MGPGAPLLSQATLLDQSASAQGGAFSSGLGRAGRFHLPKCALATLGTKLPGSSTVTRTQNKAEGPLSTQCLDPHSESNPTLSFACLTSADLLL